MATTPDITIEMLHADLREVEAHLAVWSDDKFAKTRLDLIRGAIGEFHKTLERPMMSHQRQRADLNAKPNPCRACSGTNCFGQSCMQCVHAATKAILDSAKFSTPMPVSFGEDLDRIERKVKDVTNEWKFGPFKELHEKTRKDLADEAARPRFTFGADPEMDERWIALERSRVEGFGERQYSTPPRVENSGYNPDRYMFPVMAYDLTGLHNLNYGTSRY